MRFVTTVAGIAAAAATAHAGVEYTNVLEPIYPGELNHAEILADIFGGTFSANAYDYSNGTVTAARLADDGADGIVQLLTGDANGPEDQIWGDGDGVSLVIKAKYAADTATFGWIDGSSGGVFNPLIATGNLEDKVFAALTGEFRWALDDATTNYLVTSSPLDQQLNSNPVDQMVAYHLTGLEGGENSWILFFEDRIGGDYDFNDAAIVISVVPAPGAFALLGLGALTVTRRRR